MERLQQCCTLLENAVLGNEPPLDGETDFENISLRYPLALLADFGLVVGLYLSQKSTDVAQR